MLPRRAISQEDFRQRQFALEEARQQLARAEAEHALLKAGAWKPDKAIARAAVAKAEARLAQLDADLERVEQVLPGLYELAIGGTAVGTGLNTHKDFAALCAAEIASLTGLPFVSAPDKFSALAAHDALVFASGAVKTLAVSLMKIANDVRWLASGPRAGLGELILPENEPGSSIMPGKVNPTQAEAMLMVCIQIISSDLAVTMGGAEGNFELNAFRPILINNYLHSALIMADMCDHFREFMIEGAELNEPKLKENIERSVMMVTALSPIIGYDKASQISHYAIDQNLTLKQAALDKGVSEELYDRVVNPLALTQGGSADVSAKQQARLK